MYHVKFQFKHLEQSGLDKYMEKDHNVVVPTAAAGIVSPMTMVMNRPVNTNISASPYTPRRRTVDYKCQ